MTILKVAAYSNPITAPVMLLATTMQIPVNIISSAKKCLGQAKDFMLNSIPVAQVFLIAAIGYYVFRNDLNDAMYHDKNAQKLLNQVNAKGLNSPQQMAKDGDFEALGPIVRGFNNLTNILKHPIRSIGDGILHYLGLDKLPGVGDRTIYKGLTAEQINQQVAAEGEDKGKTIVHLAASTFKNQQDLQEIEEMHARGADPSIEDQNGKTATDLAFENPQAEVAGKDLIEVFTNHGEHVGITMGRAIEQDNNKQVDAHFENAESKNWSIGGLNIGPNNTKALLTKTDKDGMQPLDHAIQKENLPVINRLQNNKIFAEKEQAVEVSKLVDQNLTEENIKLETTLLQNTNDKKTVEQIKDAVIHPELTTLCEQREEAIDSFYNQDFSTQVAKHIVSSYLPHIPDGSLGELNNFVQNPTVPTSQKAMSVLLSLPNTQAMVNEVIIEKAVSTTSKVVGWMGDFLAAVGDELGKGLTADSGDFSANTAQDYAWFSKDTQTEQLYSGSTTLNQLLIGNVSNVWANNSLLLEQAKE